ncbi:MAG: S9 family peptidase [Bacteroidota bacterium]
MIRSIVCWSILLILSSSSLFAQLPPLIDREIFFGDPEISGAQLSPDGKYITFIKPFKNVRNIWIKERKEAFEKARPLTADTTRPIPGYFWSQDSKYVLYVQDKGGDENYRVYAIDPTVAGDPVPPARNLTPQEKIRAMIIDVPRIKPNEIIVGLNDRDPSLHDVYRIDLTTGERTLIRKNGDNVAGWMTDLNGDLRLGIRQTSDGGMEILKLHDTSFTSIYSVTADESVDPIRFTPNGDSFYLETNKGDALDKTQLEIYDLKTGTTKLVEKDPKNEVDFGTAIFSDVTNELLATMYRGDVIRVYPKEKKFAKSYEQLKKQFPNGNLNLVSTTKDESLWLVNVSSDVDPGSTYVFDRKTGKTELLYRSRPNLPSKNLAPMKPLRYAARDAMEIPAYLVLPKGIPAKNLPMIIFPHGGPWARDFWGYNSTAQFLANRGYAVLLPNFRGSTGYGKKFLNSGNKQWGTGSMQHDITDGVQYLIKKGIADPKRVGISGGSYGGYATLAGLTFTPDLYAAGFDIVGPSNIITLLNSIPPYWAPMKKTFTIRVGDKDDPKDKEMLEKQSPLNSAKNITAPLFVVQGANDPRVKKAEADQIVVALRDLGRQVEYIVAPDEGHGFAGKENRIAMYTAMEQFFAKHLNGRVQKDVRDVIQKKLNDITVDVKTVTLPKPVTEVTKEIMPAFNCMLLRPDTLLYTIKMEVRGQQITINAKRTIVKATYAGKDVWRVIEETSGAMGSGVDTLDMDAVTLLPIRKFATQGPGKMVLTYSGNSVDGKLIMGPQEMPIKAQTANTVLSDGAGIELPLSTLPFADGYKATLYQFETMAQKQKAIGLAVVASEKVAVAAKDFDTWKVELTPKEGESGGTKLWIAKDSRKIIKTESKLPPQAGGGIAVMELSK